MKKSYLFLCLILCCVNVFAQRQQISTDYQFSGFSDIPFGMNGKMTYSYVVDEIGQNIKDGPLSINCKINDKVDTWVDYRRVIITIVGQCAVNATYSKGLLNGAISSNYKATMTESGKNEILTASMKGNFSDGVPNGNFVVKRNANLITTLNANYKNGVLFGAFSCSLLDEDSHVAKYSGTLSNEGKFIGVWNLNGVKATFQNGVLVSESYDNYSTRAALVELSKKYAAGTISKEELAEKNIFVKTSTVCLGDYARIAIKRDAGVEFEEIGGYDFTVSNNVTYEYLEELVGLTEAGAQLLAKQVYKKLCGNLRGYNYMYPEANEKVEIPVFDESYGTVKYKIFEYDEKYKLYFIYMSKERQGRYINPQYIVGTFKSKQEKVYISPKQMELIDEEAGKYYIENSSTLTAVMNDYANSNKLDYRTKEYLIKKRQYELRDLKVVQNEINEAYQAYIKESTPHKNNENVMLWKWEKSHQTSYIDKSSVATFEAMLKELNEKVEEVEREVREVQEAKRKEEEAKIRRPFDFMVNAGSAISIVYDSEFEKYFTYQSGMPEHYRVDICKMLKPFCKIVGYEILEVKDTKSAYCYIIKCRLIKKGKKKTQIIYEIEVEHNHGKLKAESFDINKAKLIEN